MPKSASYIAEMANNRLEDVGELPMSGLSRRATLQPWIISCNDCKMAFRTENLTPFTMAKHHWHCPGCGSDEVDIRTNYEEDRWYSMADSFKLPHTLRSVKFLKDMYEAWDPSEYEWFRQFVASIIEDARKEGANI